MNDLKKFYVQKGFTKKLMKVQGLTFWSISYSGNIVRQFVEKFYAPADQEEEREYRDQDVLKFKKIYKPLANGLLMAD